MPPPTYQIFVVDFRVLVEHVAVVYLRHPARFFDAIRRTDTISGHPFVAREFHVQPGLTCYPLRYTPTYFLHDASFLLFRLCIRFDDWQDFSHFITVGLLLLL